MEEWKRTKLEPFLPFFFIKLLSLMGVICKKTKLLDADLKYDEFLLLFENTVKVLEKVAEYTVSFLIFYFVLSVKYTIHDWFCCQCR